MHKEFESYRLNEKGKRTLFRVKASFDALLNELEGALIPSREMSIVRTKLEEASFYAAKALSLDHTNQENG
jgi:hypothetical protein